MILANAAPLIDWSISLGNILTMGGFLIGGVSFVLAVKSDVKILGVELKTLKVSVNQMTTDIVNALVADGRLDERVKALEGGGQHHGLRSNRRQARKR